MEEDLKNYTKDLEKAGTALFESEQRWATTLASIGDAVIATDKTGKIDFMNTVAEKLTGWLLAESIGNSVSGIFKIVNEKTRETVEDPITKVLAKGMVVGLANHTVLIRRDGTEISLDDSGAPIRNKQGEITGVVLIFRDIGKRRDLERQLERYTDNLRNWLLNGKKTLKSAERLATIWRYRRYGWSRHP